MRVRDYHVTDANSITAQFMNQVTTDFSNAVAEAWLDLRDLKHRNEEYKLASNSSMDYLITRINGLSSTLTGLKISAYNTPESYTNIQLDNVYGQLTLAETNRVSHSPTAEDSVGRIVALSSVGVATSANESAFTANPNARAIVDAENEIWSEVRAPSETTAGTIWVRITTPLTGITPNFVAVYPLAGTRVENIKIKRAGGYTEFTPATPWPVKIHQNFSDYENEVRVKLTGVLNIDGNYVFTIRKFDLYSVEYASDGAFIYTTTDVFNDVSTITINNPYFYPSTSQNTGMFRVRALSEDGLSVLYDSSRATTAFVVPAGPARFKVEITLYRTDGNTPFIRTIV